MRKLVYYIGVSIDGRIAFPNGVTLTRLTRRQLVGITSLAGGKKSLTKLSE